MPWAQHRQKMVKFQIFYYRAPSSEISICHPIEKTTQEYAFHSRIRGILASPRAITFRTSQSAYTIVESEKYVFMLSNVRVSLIFLFPTIWHQHTRPMSECTYTIAVKIIDFFCRCIFLHFRNAALPLFHHKCCRGTVAETSFPRCGAWNEMCAASAVWRSFFAPPRKFLNQFDYNFSRKECSTAGDSFEFFMRRQIEIFNLISEGLGTWLTFGNSFL